MDQKHHDTPERIEALAALAVAITAECQAETLTLEAEAARDKAIAALDEGDDGHNNAPLQITIVRQHLASSRLLVASEVSRRLQKICGIDTPA